MDRGAWWATVHRVAKSWARLSALLSYLLMYPDVAHELDYLRPKAQHVYQEGLVVLPIGLSSFQTRC